MVSGPIAELILIESVNHIGLRRFASDSSDLGNKHCLPSICFAMATHGCTPGELALADAQSKDDFRNMEPYHEGTYHCSRVGHADGQPDLCSARRAGFHASRVRFPD